MNITDHVFEETKIAGQSRCVADTHTDRALHGVSTLTKDQTDLLGALTLQTPTKHEQLSLL